MLSDTDKSLIVMLLRTGQSIPPDVQDKLNSAIESLENSSLSVSNDYLCCDTGQSPPNRFIWTTFDNCRALGGRASDNSNCGR